MSLEIQPSDGKLTIWVLDTDRKIEHIQDGTDFEAWSDSDIVDLANKQLGIFDVNQTATEEDIV